MNHLFRVLLLLWFPLSVMSQHTMTIGERHTLQSSLLNEERTFWIYCPDNYHRTNYATTRYPVVYLLDGERNFLTQVTLQKVLASGLYRYMPEAIVVGIENTVRSRDLTPSKSVVEYEGKKLHENSGGAKPFLEFLTGELRPHIDSIYRTNGYNLLVGHSFGGLFAMHTLVHHTQSFNAYVAIDPSLWWDNRKIYDEAAKLWPKINAQGVNLYIAMAGDDFKAEDKLRHSQTIEEFCTRILPQDPENGLRSHWKYYPDEDHGTIFLPATFDALRFIFKGITLPVKQVPNNVTLIDETYQKLSAQTGHQFVPEETLIEGIGRYALSINNVQGALELFKYNLANYPQSANAHIALGDGLKAAGKKEEAAQMYRLAVTFDPSLGETVAKKLSSAK
ncbi:MAG: alpha/beta hydrolase-fold protein [Breznakibacter sp.]